MSNNCPNWLEYPIDVLGLSHRSYNALRRFGIHTLGQLAICFKYGDLQKVRNIGVKIEAEISEKLIAYLTNLPYSTTESTMHSDEEKVTAPILEPVENRQPQSVLYPSWHFHSALNLGLSPRLFHLLQRNGINTLGKVVSLIEMSDPKDSAIRGLGPKHLANLRTALSAYKVNLPESAFTLVEFSISLTEPMHPETNIASECTAMPERIQDWLASLHKERSREILSWRYGLEREPLTLEEIGRKLGRTRERVRQIERQALEYLTNSKYIALIAEVVTALELAFDEAGGVLTNNEAVAIVTSLFPQGIRALGLLSLFAHISEEFKFDNKADVWVWGKTSVAEIQAQIREILKTMPSMNENALVAYLQQADPGLKGKLIVACLRTHPDLERREDGTVVFKEWARNRTGAIIHALRQIGRPAHYTEITRVVNQLIPEMQAHPHNIHAQMQRLPGAFVWVESGTYGLAEWGLERSEFYADIVERALRECGHPLSIQEMLTRVCDVRDCKESTVAMLLTLNPRFRQFSGSVYGLAEWRDDEFPNPSYREKRLLAAIADDKFLNRHKSKPNMIQTLRDIDELLGTARSRCNTIDFPLS